MKKTAFKLTNFVVVLSLLLTPFTSLAAAEEDFDPNFLLSDFELQNWQSMNRADIQAFLDDQSGFIANYKTTDYKGTQRTVADIIARAAKEHQINPKYILVKLQKEQSLISAKNPSQKQLDWATGYGICDSCSKSDPTLQKHKGFGVQVDSAAAIMRWYYDNLNKESWIKRTGYSYRIDSTTVRPLSLATGFLYTYTPHILGNKNFWILWQRWFEQVYPDGTLVKGQSDNTVYLIQDGKKRAFANMTALQTRFDPKYIITAPDTELSRYESAPDISLPNYSVVKSGPNYYLLDNEKSRKFANYNVVKKLGYHPDEIIEISSLDLATYQSGNLIGENTNSALGRVVKVKENNNYYYLTDTTYHAITDEQIIDSVFPHLSVEKVSATELHPLTSAEPILFKDGTLLGIKGFSKIYVIENSKKRHIANETVFNVLGYNWSNIIWTDEFTGLNHPTGQPVYMRRELQIVDKPTTNKAEVVEIISSAKMVVTPREKFEFVGEKFDTDIDSYLVADAETGEILAGKNIDTVRPLASLTKVMTAYQLMKEGVNLNRSTTYVPSEHKSIYHRFRIAPGESVLNKHLLQATLISSLNTPAKMLVDSVEKNQSKFINRMNSQIDTWKLAHTNFDDPTGGGVGNVSTAKEYLTVYRNATKNIDVAKFLGMKKYEYNERLDLDNKPRHFDNHSNHLTRRAGLPFDIITSKTGYLEEAGDNLVMNVKRKKDGKNFILITLGNPDHANKFAEPEKFAKWAINNF